jgi:RimJ/RimL family protein N-acetyltransferase
VPTIVSLLCDTNETSPARLPFDPSARAARLAAMTAPILREVATRLETERLILRCPQPGDGAFTHEAVVESLADLRAWPASLPWAMAEPSVEASETFCRESIAQFVTRTGFVYLAFERASGRFVASLGVHHIDWSVPKFELGFWCRSSMQRRGFTREAVDTIVRMLLEDLGARRLAIHTDEKNLPTRALSESLGFILEGTLRHERKGPGGELRNTCIYALVR